MDSNNRLPVIKAALGVQWEQLGDVVKRHYDMTPGETTEMQIEGVMDEVYHSLFAKLFLLPGRIFGALVPYRGKLIATEVRNWTTAENDQAMFWHRTLHFPKKGDVIFRSRMEHVGNDEIIEFVKFGMGIRMQMSVEDSALVFNSLGYLWQLGSLKLPIPSWLILGDARIVERPVSNQDFYIEFTMDHPILGRTFSYSGKFSIAGK